SARGGDGYDLAPSRPSAARAASGPRHAERGCRCGQRLLLLLADERAAEAEEPAFLGRVGHSGRDLLQPLLEAGCIGGSLLLDQRRRLLQLVEGVCLRLLRLLALD